MTSWSKDEDKYRLPEGVVRVGYDADTQRYQFHNREDGSMWEGPEGSKYGKLRRISTGTGDDKMFSSDSSPVGIQRAPTWSATSPAPTDFDQILDSIHRERSTSEAGLKSSGTAMLGSAIKRSATVTSKLTRRLSRRVQMQREEPLLEESRQEKKGPEV